METRADFPDRAETIINAAASRREGHGIADLVTPQLQGVRAELARANRLPQNQLWTPSSKDINITNENLQFLANPKFREQFARSIKVLQIKSLSTEGAPATYEEAIAFLTELAKQGEIDLDEIRRLDNQGYEFELVASPEELTPQEIRALMQQQHSTGEFVGDFYCHDSGAPVFHNGKYSQEGGKRKFYVGLVAAGSDEKIPCLLVSPNDPDHASNGANYDSSRRALAKRKMTHPAPAAFYVLEIGKEIDKQKEDKSINLKSRGGCLLDMGERGDSIHVPVGYTLAGKVYFDKISSAQNSDNYHLRPAAGGIYVPKKQS